MNSKAELTNSIIKYTEATDINAISLSDILFNENSGD